MNYVDAAVHLSLDDASLGKVAGKVNNVDGKFPFSL
jgi:hypothetical protein